MVKTSHLFLAVFFVIAACEAFFGILIIYGVVGQDGPSVVGVRLEVKEAVAADTQWAIAMDARDLMSAYEESEIKADAKYKNRRLLVTGPVAEIGKDLLGSTYMAIQAGNPVFTVQCFFKRTDEMVNAHLRKGVVVSVVGTCDGQVGNVFLKECVLARGATHSANLRKEPGR